MISIQNRERQFRVYNWAHAALPFGAFLEIPELCKPRRLLERTSSQTTSSNPPSFSSPTSCLSNEIFIDLGSPLFESSVLVFQLYVLIDSSEKFGLPKNSCQEVIHLIFRLIKTRAISIRSRKNGKTALGRNIHPNHPRVYYLKLFFAFSIFFFFFF